MQFTAMRVLIFPLLFLLGGARGDDCPPKEDVYPCTCKDIQADADLTLICSGDGIDQDNVKNALHGLQGHRNIKVVLDELKDLGKLQHDLFSGFDITILEIRSCDLEDLKDGEGPALQGLEESLRELVIVYSLNFHTELTLGHLRALKYVDISYNRLHHTGKGPPFAPDLPLSLQTLVLTNNEIDEISDQAFSNLVDIESLTLDGNRFRSIQRSLFPLPANNLRTLELDRNGLGKLPADIFTQMPVLNDVSLNNNNIRQLERKTWEHVWSQLHRVSLKSNPLSCDSHMDWIPSVVLTVDVIGHCLEPEHLEGYKLRNFLLDRY